MQPSFDFVAGDVARWQALLAPLIVDIDLTTRRKPIGQLVKSLISGRTRDAVSLAAYHQLRAQFGSAGGIAAADPRTVEAVIANVTFAHAKAEWLVASATPDPAGTARLSTRLSRNPATRYGADVA